MKKFYYLILAFVCFATLNANSQDAKPTYRRSSLHIVLMESESFPQKDLVMKSWNGYPFPDKYNNHILPNLKTMNPAAIQVTDGDRAAAGQEKPSELGGALNGAMAGASSGIVDNDADMPSKIYKFAKEKQLAKQLVAKWFNRNAAGKFNVDLVGERGIYDASELEKAKAAGQVKGSRALEDAGADLIPNTFVVFSKLNFVENEPVAKAALLLALTETAKISIPFARQKAEQLAQAAYEKAKVGYSVWTKTWLYKLKWDKSIEDKFYNEHWSNSAAFDASNDYELEFVGKESATSLVTFSLKEERTEEQIINLATVRNVDNVFAKMQKVYDVFKPKIQVSSVNPITASIGMKEGLEGGEKFEALEIVQNPDTGMTEYKSVGKVTVDKKLVWDNRYSGGEKSTDPATTEAQALGKTTFEGSKKIQVGMLLRQIK
ncbi:hypothetical protein U0R10_00100 [Aquirufa sp. OSTEICH-129V]|uniref:Uncharacterized protein n=1 Tax=Aquirufa avitistagni TaxID=3104728 RepID=A0ABW6DG80_9BACT